MRLLSFLLSICVFITQPLQAQGNPLIVAVDPVDPPFVMQATDNHFYGYDISLIEYICKTLQRSCQFVPTRFDKILDAVKTKQVDLAISSITITPERAAIVNFSLPYLISKARFIGPKKFANRPFRLALMNGKKIGMTEGSIFPEVIQKMGIKTPIIVPFTNLNKLIEALYRDKINFALLDEPTALFWQAQSARKLAVLGQSFSYGVGLGIAVHRDNLVLLNAINNALLKYQESDDFKINYHTYITSF